MATYTINWWTEISGVTPEQITTVTIDIEKGANGLTPYIGGNGNWWIGLTDTGTYAEGNGIVSVVFVEKVGLVSTYQINFLRGNPFVFYVTDGEKGDTGTTAYEAAIAGGFVGTESEFNTYLSEVGNKINVTAIKQTTGAGTTQIMSQKATTDAAAAAAKNAFIAMWNARVGSDGTYNATSGYFELNGITDLTYEEALGIYGLTSNSMIYAGAYQKYPYRTNIAGFSTFESWNNAVISSLFAYSTNIESIKLCRADLKLTSTPFAYAFVGCSNLKRILGVLNIAFVSSTPESAFAGCSSLISVTLRLLKVSISFSNSPNLNEASILYMIQNRGNGTTAITITLHPTAYAMALASSSIQAALVGSYITLASA